MLTNTDYQKINTLLDSKHYASIEDVLSFKDDLLSFKDSILGEIRSLREEITIVVGYRDQIEEHDIRISSLEKTRSATSAVQSVK